MAEAVVSSAVQRLGDLLVSVAENLSEVEGQVCEIQHELKQMQCYLKEADKKQYQDSRVRKCVTEIRKLAFKVEDVIETFAFDVSTQPAGFNGTVQKFVSVLSEFVKGHNISAEISKIKAEVNYLTACLQTHGVTKGLAEEEISGSRDVEEEYVGMEKVIEEMISELKRIDKGCEVVTIYGMTGQGKTTLARKIYDHNEFKDYCKVWICITKEFHAEKVLQNVLQQLLPRGMERKVTWMDNAKLLQELHSTLMERKCLIVIDDIPTIDIWRSIEHGFPVGKAASASKIVLTGRDENMAETGFFCRIPSLTEEEGWQLLSTKARITHLPEKRVASMMESIGRNMVKICRGLPLAISLLGGILKGKTLSEWETMYKDISFHIAKNDERETRYDEYYVVTDREINILQVGGKELNWAKFIRKFGFTQGPAQ